MFRALPTRSLWFAAVLAASAWLGLAHGQAPGAAPVQAQAQAQAPTQTDREQYDREVAACYDGRPDDRKEACLREAAAAQAERAKGLLGQEDRAFRENARRRCDPLPDDQRADCLTRVEGLGGARGSVEEGVIIRETVTIRREIRGPGPIVPVEVK